MSRAAPPRRVFLRNLVLMANIGVHPHEHGAAQRIRLNLDLWVRDPGAPTLRLDQTVDYEKLANRVRAMVGAGHVRLVESLAERIADACLEDARVLRARVRVEKLDVFPDAEAAGVEVDRQA